MELWHKIEYINKITIKHIMELVVEIPKEQL